MRMMAFQAGTSGLEKCAPLARSPASDTTTLKIEIKMAKPLPTNQAASPMASR